MQRITAVLGFLAIVLITSTTFAQDKPKSKFYDFDDMLIDGQLKIPDGMRAEARKKAKFKRLLNLKKSFLSRVRNTAGERALQ